MNANTQLSMVFAEFDINKILNYFTESLTP